MSSESHLRSVLDRAAGAVDPAMTEVDSALERSLHTGARKVRIRRMAALVAVAAVVAAAAFFGPRVFELRNDDPPVPPADTPAPTITKSSFGRRLIGTWEKDVSDSDITLDGRWTIRFRKDGRVVTDYPDEASNGVSGKEGDLYYSVSESGLHLPAVFVHCTSIAVYDWEVTGDTLRFQASRDECAHRRELLETGPWRLVSE